MKIVLIGYGKMGKAIERLAVQQGHIIVGKVDIDSTQEDRAKSFVAGDVAIEFSHPDAAYDNIIEALRAGIPVISGTTGWLDKFDKVKALIAESNGSFFYASNYSIGVNIMFAINQRLARIMNQYGDYEVTLDETHHVHKKDAPSGTALTLTNGVLDEINRKSGWSLDEAADDEIKINAYREGEIFGDHKVRYRSPIDTIELSHSAHTRDGFGLGAIMAAGWLYNQGEVRAGIHSMKEMMGLG